MTAQETVTGTRRAEQKARTRELILESARELFEKLGYQKTTIRAVAKGAGVGLGTVMSHFPDKRSLLVGTVMDFWHATEVKVFHTLPKYKSAREMFIYATKAFFEAYAEQPDLSRTLLRELSFVEGELAAGPWQKADELLGLATMLVDQAKQTGEIRSDADPSTVALALFANYMFVLHIGLVQPVVSVADMVNMLEVLTDQLFRGIGANSAADTTQKGEGRC